VTKKNNNENWDDYRYFLAVARSGTLSAAAERLGTEHTTVARHIHSLEEGLKAGSSIRATWAMSLRRQVNECWPPSKALKVY
jgi:predicted ArsR family transcriptional regulator